MLLNRKSLIKLTIVCCLALAAGLSAEAWSVRPARSEKAMVVSTHEAASVAGAEMMRLGGNAVDAAVATGFALAVVHPQAGNLGGGGFMLVRFADGRTHFLDYREKAPAAATRDLYLDAAGNVIENASIIGYRAIAVPGSVAGMVRAQKQWGKLTLAQVMGPAIRLAEEGFALSYEDARSLQDKWLSTFPGSRRIFQRDGDFYRPGETLRQPELARTLRRLAADPGEFYHGKMAQELAAFVQKGGGLITAADLAAYEVKEREPVRGAYRGYEVISAPPPSSGGIVLLQALNILEGFDLGVLGNRSAASIHLITEAFRRAFYDRAEFLGDPDFAPMPVAALLDKDYAGDWRRSIEKERASASKELRRPAGFAGLNARARTAAPGYESENTTHYSVVDAEGNAVAVTTTLNSGFGSRVTAEGLGFLLNNEMDDFTSKPGAPNIYGLVQSEANAVGPGKRPLSAMTPTIVLKDGKLFLVAGSPGGPRIISTVANILLGVVDFGLNVQEAVSAPRFHHQWLPDVLRLERGFSPDTIGLLESMGHKVDVGRYWSDGQCILIDPESGQRLGGADPRNNGRAVGY